MHRRHVKENALGLQEHPTRPSTIGQTPEHIKLDLHLDFHAENQDAPFFFTKRMSAVHKNRALTVCLSLALVTFDPTTDNLEINKLTYFILQMVTTLFLKL